MLFHESEAKVSPVGNKSFHSGKQKFPQWENKVSPVGNKANSIALGPLRIAE